MKICIDAGHATGSNISPANAKYSEGTRMFVLQGFLKAALEQYGFNVICTKQTADECPSLYDRGMTAKGCDLFLSLHSNAVGNSVNESVDYVCVFYPVSGAGSDLAQALSEVIAAVMGTRQEPQTRVRWNSAHNADYYGVIRHSVAAGSVGMILEHSFHTNTKMTQWLLDDDNLRTLADAEAALLAEFYGMEAPEVRYECLKDVKSEYYRPTLQKLMERDLLRGKGGNGEETIIDLGEDAIRILVILDRAGLFDEK